MGTLRSWTLNTLTFHLTHSALPREVAGPQLPTVQDARIHLQVQDEQRMKGLAPYAGNTHDSRAFSGRTWRILEIYKANRQKGGHHHAENGPGTRTGGLQKSP